MPCLSAPRPAVPAVLPGTSLQGACGRSTRALYESDIAPRLAAAPQLFPPAACGFDAFARAADMVQTRAFHMRCDNWLTGASQVGAGGAGGVGERP